MKKLSFINRFLPSYKWKVAAIIICGVVVGGGGLFMYLLSYYGTLLCYMVPQFT